MKVIYPITLDCKKTNIQKTIQANTGEGNERQLVITLVSGNKEIELTNETVSVCGVKPDGTEFANTATINEDGKIEYTLTTQNVAAAGDVDCNVRVVGSDSLLYSAKFVIHVEEELTNEETETSSNEWTELITALQEVRNMSVRLYKDEGVPTTNPEDYPNVATVNFYFDETNEKLYYSKAVTLTTVTWERIVSKDELDTALATKQDTLTAGDGIDLTDNEISVDLYPTNSHLTIVNGKLSVNSGSLGTDTQLRQSLVNTTTNYPLASKSYVDNEFNKRVVESSSLPPDQSVSNNYIEGTIWVHQNAPYHSYLLINKTFNAPYYRYVWLDLSNIINSHNFDMVFENKLESSVSDGLDYDIETGLSVWLDSASSNLLSFNGSGAVTLTGDTIANDSGFKSELADYVYTESEVDSLLGGKQNKLTAGTNITIDANNVISASGGSGTSYTFTDGLVESSGTVGVDIASGSKLLIDANDKLDVDLSSKQDTIDSTNKLSADYVDDTSTTNKFVTEDEKAAIGKEPKYELIKTIDISELSEPVSMITVSKDSQGNSFAYDDILVDLTSGKASADNSKYQVLITNDSSTYYTISRNNYLGTASGKNIYETFTRENETLWNLLICGSFVYQGGGKVNVNSYTDKITQVRVLTDSTFTEGVLKIYGKVKY